MDPCYAPAYGNRAHPSLSNGMITRTLRPILNEALRLIPVRAGYYINRGLVRYQMNDLRGAMADYDQVISMDSRNLIARFNRGLLRFKSGIITVLSKTFDVVIQQEPDNYGLLQPCVPPFRDRRLPGGRAGLRRGLEAISYFPARLCEPFGSKA